MGLWDRRKRPNYGIRVSSTREQKGVRWQSACKVAACLLLAIAGAQAQKYAIHVFRQPDGLKNLSVNAMAADREGFLWIATENGVFRFLGSSFERFGIEQGIAEIDVRGLVAGPDGSIWAGTDNNVYRWDGQRFQPAGTRTIRVHSRFSMAVEDARRLLIVDRGNLFRLEHDAAGRTLSYSPLFSKAAIAAHPNLGQVVSVGIVHEPEGGVRIWFGCGKRLCALLDQPGDVNSNQDRVVEWGQNQGLPEDRWDGVLLDQTGTLWAGGGFHVAVLPRGLSRFVDRTIPGSEPSSSYSHAPLLQDGQGRVLAPTGDGLARWNGAKWQDVSAASGLQLTGSIMGMVLDGETNLWICAHGDGLFQWAGYGEWEAWTQDQGLPSAVIWDLIPVNSDRLLAGTDKGPAWISQSTGRAEPAFAGRWSFGEVESVGLDRHGDIWAATLSGNLLRIDPKNGRTVEIAKVPVTIITGVLDGAGRLFLGTRDGVWTNEARNHGGDFKRVTAVDTMLPSHVSAEAGCLAPNGDVWFLAQNRLLREENDLWTIPPIEGLPQLPGELLSLSCARDGSLWATGETDGVWRFVPQGGRLQAAQLPIPPEFHSLAPLSILADHRGWIWMGTDLGVLAWNGHEWRHLTRESGLVWPDVDQNALAEDRDGSVWIGTSGGLSHLIHPESVFVSQPIGITVTQIERGNQSLMLAKSLALPWTSEPLNIQISSPTMRNRSELVFEYRMQGLHSGWIQSQNGEAVFSSLPPGDYTFSARATNPALNAVSETLQMQISVLPPWWRSSWMLALYALALLCLLWGFNRFYEGHLLARSRELEALVSERTRELEASRAQLRIQATHDELTGMMNRKAVLAALASEMRRAVRDSTTVGVALVDLDHFKRINDVCGHLAGDEALRVFAESVRGAIRPYDHAGRYGGEEFLLVLSHVPLPDIKARLINLQRSISNLSFRWREHEFTINCSAGVSVYSLLNHRCSLEELLTAADQALYQAKASGRNRVVFGDDIGLGAKASAPQEEEHHSSAT